MCEGEYCVVCFVGYGLPIGCCLAGGAMTCYGCYRYYFLTNQRRLHEQQHRPQRPQQAVTQQPKKADTLKRKMLNKFLATMDKIHGIETPDTENGGPEQSTSSSPTKPGDSCPICFEDYEGDPTAIFMGVVKSCHHYFHFECLWEWLEHNSSCPLCRTTTTLTEADIMGTSLLDVQKLFPGAQVNEVRMSHNPSTVSMAMYAQQQQQQEDSGQPVVSAQNDTESNTLGQHMGSNTDSLTTASTSQIMDAQVGINFQAETSSQCDIDPNDGDAQVVGNSRPSRVDKGEQTEPQVGPNVGHVESQVGPQSEQVGPQVEAQVEVQVEPQVPTIDRGYQNAAYVAE